MWTDDGLWIHAVQTAVLVNIQLDWFFWLLRNSASLILMRISGCISKYLHRHVYIFFFTFSGRDNRKTSWTSLTLRTLQTCSVSLIHAEEPAHLFLCSLNHCDAENHHIFHLGLSRSGSGDPQPCRVQRFFCSNILIWIKWI